MANATSYIYAGAAHWTAAGGTQNPGGLFRRAVGDDHWQALTNGHAGEPMKSGPSLFIRRTRR